ncbi:MAG TPA: hypothetical protein VE973_03925, partial [Candidatus Limnocylindria bacterium]|nr:hypothetical protein [Candidatus Limnocylindria bacterium]
DTVLELGLMPGYREVSRWVWTQIAAPLISQVASWQKRFAMPNSISSPKLLAQVLKHSHVRLDLQAEETGGVPWENVVVVSAARMAPRGEHYKAFFQGLGRRLLSEASDPQKAKSVVVLDAFRDFNPKEGESGARPSLHQCRYNLRRGAKRKVNIEMLVERHQFLEGPGSKVLTAFIATAA